MPSSSLKASPSPARARAPGGDRVRRHRSAADLDDRSRGERKEVKITPKLQPESFGLPEPPTGSNGPCDRDQTAGIWAGSPTVPGSSPGSATTLPRLRRKIPQTENFTHHARPASGPVPSTSPALGLRLSERSPELDRRFRLNRSQPGFDHHRRRQRRTPDQGGLDPVSVITRVADRDVSRLADFREAVSVAQPKENLIIRILKGAKAEFRLIPGSRPRKLSLSQEPRPRIRNCQVAKPDSQPHERLNDESRDLTRGNPPPLTAPVHGSDHGTQE